MDTQTKLNVHNTLIWGPGCHIKVFWVFNLDRLLHSLHKRVPCQHYIKHGNIWSVSYFALETTGCTAQKMKLFIKDFFMENFIFVQCCRGFRVFNPFQPIIPFLTRGFLVFSRGYIHCVKSVRIRSFSDPYFATFGLNKEIYYVNLGIQSKYGKMRTRKTPNMDTFYPVIEREYWLEMV